MIDVQRIREDFPILKRRVHGKPLVYLDNAATTQKPRQVIEGFVEFYETYNANIHRGVHLLSQESTDLYERTRTKVQAFINAADPAEIVFVNNATEAINLVAYSWGRKNIGPGDEIVLTEMEHHSNFVPWQMLALENGALIRMIPILPDGQLDLAMAAKFIGPKTKFVSVAHASNVLGTINDVPKIVEMAHRYGALVMVDGAQSAPHMPVDVQALGCDFFAFSAHKMLGPTGVGVLYGRLDLLEAMPPFLGGGSMISRVRLERTTFAAAPTRFEAGTPNYADVVVFGKALDYLNDVGMENVRQHEIDLTKYALEQMSRLPGMRIFGPEDVNKRGGVVSFALGDIHPHDVGTIVDFEGIAIRAGHHCAQPLMRALNVPATARASFYIYNTHEEVDALVRALNLASEKFSDAVRTPA